MSVLGGGQGSAVSPAGPDCVLGYHLNPLTCGVAKFNLALSRRLGVPALGLLGPEAAGTRRPLLSVKLSEFRRDDAAALGRVLDTAPWRATFSLFLHDWTGTGLERALLERAGVVFCGNAEMAATVRPFRPDAVEAWCPSTVLEPQRFVEAELSVFSFGMAHKVRTAFYQKLDDLLRRTGRSSCLYLSTALHEDTTLDESFSSAFEELREIFGPRIYFLGYLSDTAVYNYLLATTFFAAFFDRGVRANNTTVNAAMSCGSVVITNLDEYSPPAFAHLDSVIDIRQAEALPVEPGELKRLGARATATATGAVGWDALIETMARHEAAPRGR